MNDLVRVRLVSGLSPWQSSRPDANRLNLRREKAFHVDKTELQKVETYLRQTFSNAAIKVQARPKKTDSAEVYIGDEFIGIVFLDDEDGDRSYSFTMSILDTDLE
jgi:Protein of unknown function (DUF3126)